METVKLHLTPKQMHRLATGGAVMIAPHHMGGEIETTLHKHKVMKMQKNHEAGKKFRLVMEPEELRGGSFAAFMRKIKNGASKVYNAYKTHVRPTVGPYIRKGLKEGIHAGLEIGAATSGDPEAVALANAIATQLESVVDWIGNKTGAYGIRAHRRRVML